MEFKTTERAGAGGAESWEKKQQESYSKKSLLNSTWDFGQFLNHTEGMTPNNYQEPGARRTKSWAEILEELYNGLGRQRKEFKGTKMKCPGKHSRLSIEILENLYPRSKDIINRTTLIIFKCSVCTFCCQSDINPLGRKKTSLYNF